MHTGKTIKNSVTRVKKILTALVAAELGDVARAKDMTQIAQKTGFGRESLYKALLAEGNSELSTILKVMDAFGLKLHARPRKTRKAA
ncbi:MAG: hypothetical protein APR55_01640 [Methanolinea sp. SDB]|nr:MAG: hypothetical protein APR55_01640 [Methanolinea sp. SDB]